MRTVTAGLVLVGLMAVGCKSDKVTQPPSDVPSNVRAAIAGSTVDVSWNAVSGASGYKVYMASTSGVTRLNVATLPSNMTHPLVSASFDHPLGLDPSTKWFFVVTTVRADDTESAESCEVSAKIATNEATRC